MNQGKVTLREVGSKSMNLEFDQDKEWVHEALVQAAPHEDLTGMSPQEWAKASRLKGEITLERLDPEYSVYGRLEGRMPLLCPRCGESGSSARSSEFRLFLVPLGPREHAEEGDDPDYIFLETPFIDLVSVLAEQIVNAEPVVEYPDQDRGGLPHKCEAALNVVAGESLENPLDSGLAAGQSPPKERKSPFEILATLKVPKTVKGKD